MVGFRMNSGKSPTDTTSSMGNIEIAYWCADTHKGIICISYSFWFGGIKADSREPEAKFSSTLKENSSNSFFVIAASTWRLPHCDIGYIAQGAF